MRAFLLLLAVLAVSLSMAKSLGGLKSLFCALQRDGQVYCWGKNQGVGNGATGGSSPFPAKMLNVKQATDIASGEQHTCIVDEGRVRCTGQGTLLGQNTSKITSSTILLFVEGVNDPVDQVYAGANHNCLVTKQGGVKCWGSNQYGELGNSMALSNRAAYAVQGYEYSGVREIAIGYHHTCMLTTRANIVCAGRNTYGQLGRGSSSYLSNYNMTQVALSDDIVFISVSCGYEHTCAVRRANGAVLCWGQNTYGQLGSDSVSSGILIPTNVPGMIGPATSVYCGMYNTFVLLAGDNLGMVAAFGKNTYGVLGLNDTTKRTRATLTFGNRTDVLEVRGGEDTTCILLQSGEVQCVGNDYYNQLGNGASERANSLILVDVYGLPIPVAATIVPTNEPTKFISTNKPTTSEPMDDYSEQVPQEEEQGSLWWISLVVLIPLLLVGVVAWKRRNTGQSPITRLRQVLPGYTSLLETPGVAPSASNNNNGNAAEMVVL